MDAWTANDPAPGAPRVVVGYDGSSAADRALDWAVGEAARRGLPLTVATALDLADPGSSGSADLDPVLMQQVHTPADRARSLDAGLAVSQLTVTGGAAAMLVDLACAAELIVVGGRGDGGLAGALLGPVAFAVSVHAHCPVAVVAGAGSPVPGPEAPVLCAVDGSAAAKAALRYAADVASSAAAVLTVLSCWTPPSSRLWEGAYGGADGEVDAAARRQAVEAARAAEASVRAWHPTLEIRAEVVEGAAARVVPDAAAGHALVVVGSRGRGGFAGLLLGSVSRAVIHAAGCPVVVVRPALASVPVVRPVEPVSAWKNFGLAETPGRRPS